MLTTQFAFFLHPVKKGALRGAVYYGAAQGHVFKAFSIIVGIDLTEGLVQQIYKTFEFWRTFFKFDDPLMRSAFVIAKINGSSRIFFYDRPGLLAGFIQSTFGIIDDQFLTKGIDKMFGAAGNLYAIR